MSYGFVYLLSNPSMPGYFKVGLTKGSPHQRAQELSSKTCVPLAFDLICYVESTDCSWLEATMHRWLENYRVNESREFFEIPEYALGWLLGLYKFNPWSLAYTEVDMSAFSYPGFEDVNPWKHGGDQPERSHVPVAQTEIRLIAG